ncbi:MAG: DNA repair protein RecO [Planctomycetaceae bacterium]
MNDQKTEALVIRLADFSNTSRVVTFFTRDFGKVSTIAKGGKRLTGPFESALDLLADCGIVFLRKSSSALDILTEARLINRFRPNPDSLESFYAGCYVSELLAGLTEDYDPHPVLFETARWTLAEFSREVDYRLPLLRFELVLLRENGQLPSFDLCVHCGSPIEVGGRFSFWVTQGGLLCSSCQTQESTTHQIQAGTVAILRRLAEASESAASRMSASPQQLREMRYTMTEAISAILGRRPKSLSFLKP